MAVIDKLEYWLEVPLISIGDDHLRIADLIFAVAILLISSIVVRIVSRAATAAARHSRMREQDIYVITRVLRYLVYGIAVVLALSTLGVSFDKLVIVAGALGVGIGFGLQSIVNNFVSGIIILFEKSLRVGDIVELSNGLLGEVKEINVRSTLIRTYDNADILVPNADFISNQVNNWTLNDDIRRYSIPFSVAYGTDLQAVTTAGLEAANSLQETLQTPGHKPAVLMTAMADSGVEFLLSVWTDGEWSRKPGLVKSHYLCALYESLRRHNIEIPFPQLDLHMRSGLPPAQA